MVDVHHGLERLYIAIRGLPHVEKEASGDFEQRFQAAMDDDFNMPEAFAVLFDMARDINRLREQDQLDQAAAMAMTLKRLAGVFGFLQEDPETFLKGKLDASEVDKIEQLIDARTQARAEKNWKEADRLRDELVAMGVVIEDAAGKTTWRRE